MFINLLSLRLYLAAETSVKKNVEDVMPIATGHEREELEAELEVIALCLCIYAFLDPEYNPSLFYWHSWNTNVSFFFL